LTDFQIYVQIYPYSSVTLGDVQTLQIGSLKRNNWNLPEAIFVRIHKHNLILDRSTALVTLRSARSVQLDNTQGHYAMEREILNALMDAPADLIPLRRVVNGRKQDAVWWLSQTTSEAFLDEAIPTLELCHVVSITEIERPR
jgi:hypothetical protein